MTVRDKLWIFTSKAHDDDVHLGGLDREYKDRFANVSRITPAEGAHMLGVKNAIMVTSYTDGVPAPFSMDAYGYMESFCRMNKVLWSVTGSGGFRHGNEEAFICDLAEKYPNMAGAYLDDIFGKAKEEDYAKQLWDIRAKLDKACRPMEIWSTCYIEDVEKYSAAMYDPIDVITYWNMDSEGILELEEKFSQYEKLLPDKKKVLGLYLYDYKRRAPVSVELMEKQCETGLKWLKEGRIEGMCFLTNCVMGVGFACEYWLRNWIDKVGDEVL